MMEPTNLPHSPSWILQTYASFIVSLGGTLGGLYFVPLDLWAKAFLFMGVLFTVTSCLSLAKTVRDQHEAKNLHHQIKSAQAEKLLREVGDDFDRAVSRVA